MVYGLYIYIYLIIDILIKSKKIGKFSKAI